MMGTANDAGRIYASPTQKQNRPAAIPETGGSQNRRPVSVGGAYMRPDCGSATTRSGRMYGWDAPLGASPTGSKRRSARRAKQNRRAAGFLLSRRAAGLVGLLLAAFLLAPGEARAADECGAISSTARTVTCTATHGGGSGTFADGIIYQNAAPGANNVATVVVPGGSTAWTVTSGAGATRASNGITLDSDAAAGGGLALTVGGASATANRVAIRQRASNANSGTEDNNGILIVQERTGASTTTVTVNAGVTIGESGARMNRHGILARVNAGSGAATFTNHAAIHSTLEGINVQRSSSAGTTAATTIENHGAISSGEEGIYLNYAAAASNAHTGGATITNTGAITTSGATQDGILMDYRNRGDAEITNSGAVTAIQSGSNGISMQHTGAAGGATVTNSGDIRSHALGISVKTSAKTAAGSNAGASVTHSGGDIDVSNQAGILVTVGEEGETIANAGDAELMVTGGSVEARDEALLARNRQAGNVVIEVSEGVTLTSRTGEGILGNLPSSNVVGGVTITNAAAITAAGVGILVRRMAPTGTGNISITNHGAIKRTGGDVNFDGIRVEDDRGKGHVTVTNSGDIGEAGAMAMHLHGIQVQKTGSSGDLSVTTTGGSITAKDRGIYVTDNDGHTGAVTISNGGDVTADRPIYVNRDGEGPVTITNTGGTVRTESSHAIYAWNKTGDANDVTVNVEGGTAQSSLSALTLERVNVVNAVNRGAGDVIVDVDDGATLISRVSEAVYANLNQHLAPDNQVKITQGGGMMGRTGVYARAGGYALAAEGEEVAARAEGNPDVIDVTWTGSFSHGTAEAEKALVAQNDEGRFSAASVFNLVVFSQNIEAERATDGLYGSAAGVEAAVMPRKTADSTGIIQVVAGSDVPGEFPDAAAQTALLAETGDASRRTAILAQFRAMLRNEEIDAAAVLTAIDGAATTVADLSDEEIVDYLGADTPGARGNLYNVLFGLSEAEKAILRAVATGEGVDAALTAAGFTDDPADDEDYWSRVMALLDRYNPGNVRIAMNGGSIVSRGDGIRAYYATPHANNGAIDVTIGEGAEVTAANAGVYVANAGMGDDGLLKQTVEVNGRVTGGADAGVHLVGGGRLTVGATGEVLAGSSGVGALVNAPGPAEFTINGLVRGGAGGAAAIHLTGGGLVTVGLTGRVEANGAEMAIRGDGPAVRVDLHAESLDDSGLHFAANRVRGVIGGTGLPQSSVRYLEVDENGPTNNVLAAEFDEEKPGELLAPDLPETPASTFDCAVAGGDRRCELYEALPSVLLAMAGRMPAYAERMAAPRGANGAWARVEAARGEWTARKGASPLNKRELSRDYDVGGGRAGYDFESAFGRLGFSAHALRSRAKMGGAGEIALNGAGLGLSGTWTFESFWVDARAQATWLDAEIDSTRGDGMKLENDASGSGVAFGVEIGGRRSLMKGAGVSLTPRAGLTLTTATLGDFSDGVGDPATRIKIGDARSVKAGAGVTLKTPTANGGLFLTLDATRELADETSVELSGTKLETSVEPASIRLGAGGAFKLSEGVDVSASLFYEKAGSGNREYGGGVNLRVRF